MQTQNKTVIDRLISGTYVHKLLILDIALWISKSYYIKVESIVNEYNLKQIVELKNNKDQLEIKIKEYETLVESKNDRIKSLEESNKELDTTHKELDNTNKKLSESVNKLNDTLESVKPKIIVPPPFENKYSTFTLIKLNSDNVLPYYITTVCERDFNTRIDNLKSIYPNLNVVLKLNKVANAKYLFDTIKKSEYIIESKSNYIKFNIPENEFIIYVLELIESLDIV